MPLQSNKRRKKQDGSKTGADRDQTTLIGFKSGFVRALNSKPERILDSKLGVEAGDFSDEFQDTQEDLKYLDRFDLNSKFGPCSEISRLQRLERAKKFDIYVEFRAERKIRSSCHQTSIIDRLMSNLL
ncbi:DNA polymerase delta subunit 4 [Cryptosporidium felis]|nr:DNA polymerase delta subunit 4 [Cryptosporidium felis]